MSALIRNLNMLKSYTYFFDPRLSDDSEAGEERLRPGSISPEEAENGRARLVHLLNY